MNWTDKLKIGDKISYHINVNYKRTGEIKEFVIDNQELLDNIIKYESDNNYHSMEKIVN